MGPEIGGLGNRERAHFQFPAGNPLPWGCKLVNFGQLNFEFWNKRGSPGKWELDFQADRGRREIDLSKQGGFSQ